MNKGIIKLFYFVMTWSTSLFALEEQPWFGNVYEFNFLSKYTYAYFSSVDKGVPALKDTIHNNLFYFDLEFPFASQWSIDVDAHFADISHSPFHFSSSAVQVRYLWLDDIVGDAISFATGVSLRLTSPKGLEELISYYHGDVDVEGNVSIGREFEPKETLRFRLWAFGAIGLANKGSPWLRGKASLDWNNNDCNKGSIFLESISGYGRHHHVDIHDFHGYASIRHKGVALGAKYGHRFGRWGTLGFEYKRLLFAECSPKNVNYFSLSYLLPFSF